MKTETEIREVAALLAREILRGGLDTTKPEDLALASLNSALHWVLGERCEDFGPGVAVTKLVKRIRSKFREIDRIAAHRNN